jgi:hypothetical protein
MAYNQVSPNTGTSFATQVPASVRQTWEKGAQISEMTHDWFRQFEGASLANPIPTKTDLAKEAGQKITFTTRAGMYGRAKLGEELFENDSDFEELMHGTYDLEVDWFRHGSRLSDRARHKMGWGNEIKTGLNVALGEWLGRLKTKHMFMSFLHKGATDNHVVINGKSSMNKIENDDTLTYDILVQMGAMMETNNGGPAMVGRDKENNPISKYIVASSTDALFSLKLDPDYKAAIRDAGMRGPENLMFKGGYENLDGHVVKAYKAIQHDGAGPTGSPINPRADLGVAIVAGTGAIDIKGGGNATYAAKTNVDYFEDFPNHDFRFSPAESVTAGTGTFYVIIYNRTGDDAGKWGFYEFNGASANDGVKLPAAGMVKRLRAGAGGIGYAQVGNVEWDAAKNTDAHPEGSYVFLASENGVPIGHTIFMGAGAMLRGIGAYSRQRGEDRHQDFITDVFIKSVFGQAPRLDARGRAPGFLTLTHAINYPGITITPTLA